MDFIAHWATEEFDYFLYQCPQCKKVEVEEKDFFAKR